MDGKFLVIKQTCFYAWIEIVLYLDKIAFFLEGDGKLYRDLWIFF